jgi:hypothetical protein
MRDPQDNQTSTAPKTEATPPAPAPTPAPGPQSAKPQNSSEAAKPASFSPSQPPAGGGEVAPASPPPGSFAQATDPAAVAKVSDLEAKLAEQAEILRRLMGELETQRTAAAAAESKARAERRLAFFNQVNGGLHAAQYAAMAPTDADADTEEGRAKLTEWAKANPALFRGLHGSGAALGHGTNGNGHAPAVGQAFAGRVIRTLGEILEKR